jgi:hypothetical protein
MVYNILYKYIKPSTVLQPRPRERSVFLVAKYKDILHGVQYRMAFPLFYLFRPAAYIIIVNGRVRGRVRIKDFIAQ